LNKSVQFIASEAWLLLEQQRGPEVPLVAYTQLEAIAETWCAGRLLKPHVFTVFSHCSPQSSRKEENVALVIWVTRRITNKRRAMLFWMNMLLYTKLWIEVLLVVHRQFSEAFGQKAKSSALSVTP